NPAERFRGRSGGSGGQSCGSCHGRGGARVERLILTLYGDRTAAQATVRESRQRRAQVSSRHMRHYKVSAEPRTSRQYALVRWIPPRRLAERGAWALENTVVAAFYFGILFSLVVAVF